MKSLFGGILAALFSASSLFCATLDNHPHWKSDCLPDLYYEVLARSAELESRLQAPDGRFRTNVPESPADEERSWRVTVMQYIYVPALLYTSQHPVNPLQKDKRLLEMALRAGDYLASIIDSDGEFKPTVNGRPVSALDSHRWLYCWAEAYGLLKDHLDQGRKAAWSGALIRAATALAGDLAPRVDRPRYIAPFIGTSPNHYGLWATTLWRIGMILEKEEWVQLAEPVLYRFVREVAPGGYWAEHDGPTMNYDYLNGSVAGLYWHFSSDPEALRAMRLNTDFHIHWTTPDGIDIYTIDQRNRNSFRVNASWGLFTFCYFPEGRRFSRFKLLAALGDSDDPLAALGLQALARIAQDAHYHTDGAEAPIPQELHTYRHTLDRPAVVKKTGPWVYSFSALLSPPSTHNQFFLDRIVPISLWHENSGHIIAGGNSKGQPELATFMVKRADGSTTDLPLDALISGSWDADTMCVANEGFSLRLTIACQSNSAAVISVQAERTYNHRDTVFLNLPLRLLPGGELETGNGKSYKLAENEIRLSGASLGGSLSYNHWRITLPESARFVWPYYTYTPYGPVRVPRNIRTAIGVVSIPLSPDSSWLRLRFSVE
jgi:hypothetical protein